MGSRATSATSRPVTPPPSESTDPATSIVSPSTRSRTPLARNPDERRAARHYRLRGYRILGQNVWSGAYELDLIVRRGRRVVFCEVKGKSGDGFGDPLEMVHEEKLRRLHLAAESWLARRPELSELELRFEVVAVRAGALERVAV